jgi:metallophosphoesterase superfamily enzyme
VFPLGDITNRNTPEQWKNAQAAMRVLETARMPFCMVPGNHAYGIAKASKGDVHDGEQLWRELVTSHDNVIMPL